MTRPRSRRAVLRTGALAVAGLAGCVGGRTDDATRTTGTPTSRTTTRGPSTDEPATDSTTADATTEASTTDGTTAESPAFDLVPKSVQSSFLYHTTPDRMDVAAVEGGQFAFVEVRLEPESSGGDWPSPDEFALVADGQRYPATVAPGPISNPYEFHRKGQVYDPDRERTGWLAFELPNPLDAGEIDLAYRDREESVGDKPVDAGSAVEQFRAALGRPPADFRLVSLDAPDRVGPNRSFDVTCTVENVGDGDGTFRACLNRSGPTYAPYDAETPVSAGERREVVWSFGRRVGAETERVGFHFRSPVADRDFTVEVASSETETTAG